MAPAAGLFSTCRCIAQLRSAMGMSAPAKSEVILKLQPACCKSGRVCGSGGMRRCWHCCLPAGSHAVPCLYLPANWLHLRMLRLQLSKAKISAGREPSASKNLTEWICPSARQLRPSPSATPSAGLRNFCGTEDRPGTPWSRAAAGPRV